MKTTTQTYKDLFESGAVQEYRITIDGITYGNDDIKGTIELSQKLFDKDTFTVGSFTVDTLKVRLVAFSENIPRRASVEFEYRYTDGETPSEWVYKFKGNVSKRTKYTDEVLTIEAQSFASDYTPALDVLSVNEYPANARTVANQLANYLGLSIDNINDIINLPIVEFPSNMTVVEALRNIAKISGGNWTIVDDNLRLIILGNNVSEIYNAQKIESLGSIGEITKIEMYFDDASGFESGNDVGSTIVIDSKWATQSATDYVHGVLNGYEYKPIQVTGAYIDPALEIGDIIEIDGEEVLLANVKWIFGGIAIADIEVPITTENNYDDPYNKLVQQQFSKKVSLGDSYQGITISREKGFEALMSPDGSEENAIGRYYADLTRGIAFQTRNVPSDPWHDWMYFDTNDKTFKISLYDNAVERIDDTLVDFGLSLEGIEGKIEGVSFGSILINHNGEDDTYGFWEDFVTSDPLEFNTGMTFRTGMTNYTIFEPIEDSNTLSNSKISFFANGSTENGPFTVMKDYKYGFRIRRVNGNQHFSIEVREYNSNKEYIQKQTFVFNNVQSYHDISNIEFGNDTEYVGLRYIISGVSWSNRLELAEGMFGIGAPKPYVENVDGVRAWAQSQFQLQQNQIDLKVSQTDFTGNKLVSMINLQPSNIKISSKNIDISGLVTISNLSDGITTISGSNIKTGKIKSQYLEFDNAVGTNVKLTGEINATKGTFSNVNISGNLNAGTIGNLNVTSTGIAFPNGKLKLESNNNQIAFGTLKMKQESISTALSGMQDAMVMRSTAFSSARPIVFLFQGGKSYLEIDGITGSAANGLALGGSNGTVHLPVNVTFRGGNLSVDANGYVRST